MVIKKITCFNGICFLVCLFCVPLNAICSNSGNTFIHTNKTGGYNITSVDFHPFTDYYNLKGKRVKQVDDNKNEKKIVLTYSKDEGEVDLKIKKGQVINCPSLAMVNNLQETFTRTEATKREHYFAVGVKGKVSKVVEGSSGKISVETKAEAKRDLAQQGDVFLYDVHSHELGPDTLGFEIHYGWERPSDMDRSAGITEPCIVLGYSKSEIKDFNTIDGPVKVIYTPCIGFYNSNGLLHKQGDIEFDKFIYVVKKINKSS